MKIGITTLTLCLMVVFLSLGCSTSEVETGQDVVKSVEYVSVGWLAAHRIVKTERGRVFTTMNMEIPIKPGTIITYRGTKILYASHCDELTARSKP